MSRTGLILWDWDGTLIQTNPMWRRSFTEAFNAESGNRKLTLRGVPFLPRVYLWDHWDEPHPSLNSSEAYWSHMAKQFEPLMRSLGLSPAQAERASRGVRQSVINPAAYRLHPETLDVLELMKRAGWRQAIVSNHVPELSEIIRQLGLAPYFEAIISSGSVGYEKPHPGIYQYALDRLKPRGLLWMVGDNLIADALGAQHFGIPSILVRQPKKDFHRKAPDLWGAARFILNG